MPGETLPTFVPESPVATSTPSHPPHVSVIQQNQSGFMDMFQCFQSSIEAQLSSVATSLDRVTERITQLET